ncbi:hypothetical protein KCU93_g9420, partial [Aureobasidium melanogenum]
MYQLGDVSGWLSMIILEAIIDAPHPSDYLALATVAAANAALNVKTLQDKLEISRAKDTSLRKVEEYIGRYQDEKRKWTVVVRASQDSSSGLEVAFQGLDSQVWALSHYERDTFLWLSSREEQAKKGRMVTYPLSADHFKLIFQANDGGDGEIDRLVWRHEAIAPDDKGYFWKDS